MSRQHRVPEFFHGNTLECKSKYVLNGVSQYNYADCVDYISKAWRSKSAPVYKEKGYFDEGDGGSLEEEVSE